MALTPLSTILARMDRYQAVSVIEAQYKVRDLDEAIRSLRRETAMPWMKQKGSLRVFQNILEYPVASDHDELAYLDKDGSRVSFASSLRFRYTSLQEFYADPNNRNDLAEIWDGNTRFLGVRVSTEGLTERLVSDAENDTGWAYSGDVTSIAEETVFTRQGNGSIRVNITSSGGTATVTNAPTSFSDTNYKRKYYFRSIYLDSAPTSITLRFGNDGSNYLSKTVTTQFSGQPFKADQWNLVAMDLNEATTTGTITATAFDYEALILTGAATGVYYVDASYLREWKLLDYWYYSIYMIALVGSTTGNQEYFFNSSDVYSTDSQLVGDSEWADAIMFEALVTAVADKENDRMLRSFEKKRDKALLALAEKYPDEIPVAITAKYNFETSYPATLVYYDEVRA